MIKDKDLKSIQEVRILVEKAKEAQHILSKKSQEEIDKIVKAMADVAYKESDRLAKMAASETGFGVYEDKIIKNKFASKAVYEYIKDMKTIGIIDEDKENKILEIATPVGVIAGLIPSTNPTSTAIYKALIAVKSGNSIVFSPHPAATNCISEVVRVLQQEAKMAGAPEGILNSMTIPTMEGTAALMRHKDIALILATGGSAMVKEAYSSGTPALGVGPGNVPAFIERSADIPLAVKRIVESKTFDNGTICASEQAIVTEDCIKKQVKTELVKQRVYFLTGDEVDKVGRTIQDESGRFNSSIAGRSAIKIAEMAGIKVPRDTKILIAEQKNVGKKYPFSREKLSPILALYSEEDWEKACEKCIELLNYGGLGHSLVIHSRNEDIIREFALKKPVSRILVNTPSSQGAIGASTNLAPSLTLGCGAVGGSATSDNVSPLNLINIRRMAYGVKEVEDIGNEYKDQSIKSKSSFNDMDIERITKIVMTELKKYN
ncbi:acetaldehyde dehydrogenase (acetylating) [Anaeromonas frigoriresistens]|uniref:acetaldehyde dehydrogenase (acetylating) n=1 Tax=Anaeromonas frigoriresistens TaxID=2683708 RepID=UPI0033162760